MKSPAVVKAPANLILTRLQVTDEIVLQIDSMLYGKTSALGLDKAASASVNVEGDDILVAYGYPARIKYSFFTKVSL